MVMPGLSPVTYLSIRAVPDSSLCYRTNHPEAKLMCGAANFKDEKTTWATLCIHLTITAPELLDWNAAAALFQ